MGVQKKIMDLVEDKLHLAILKINMFEDQEGIYLYMPSSLVNVWNENTGWKSSLVIEFDSDIEILK